VALRADHSTTDLLSSSLRDKALTELHFPWIDPVLITPHATWIDPVTGARIDPDEPLDISRFCNSARVISYNKLARQACSVQQVVAPATRFTRSTSTIIFEFRAFDRCLRIMEFSERAIVARIFDGNFVFLFFRNRYFRFCPVFFLLADHVCTYTCHEY
jgi:hypothetical protein